MNCGSRLSCAVDNVKGCMIDSGSEVVHHDARTSQVQVTKFIFVVIDNSKHGNLLYDRSSVLVLQMTAAAISEREKTRFGAERGVVCVQVSMPFI